MSTSRGRHGRKRGPDIMRFIRGLLLAATFGAGIGLGLITVYAVMIGAYNTGTILAGYAALAAMLAYQWRELGRQRRLIATLRATVVHTAERSYETALRHVAERGIRR